MKSITPERIKAFLDDLALISAKHDIFIDGIGESGMHLETPSHLVSGYSLVEVREDLDAVYLRAGPPYEGNKVDSIDIRPAEVAALQDQMWAD